MNKNILNDENPVLEGLMEAFKMALLCIVFCALLMATSARAQTPVYLPYRGDLLVNNGPILLPTNGTTNLSGQKVLILKPRTSIAFFPVLSGAGGATVSNVVCQLAVSPWYSTNNGAYTGTNLVITGGTSLFSTVTATGLQISTTLNGTTGVVGFQTLNFSNWDGSIAMELLSVQNLATNAVAPTLSNLWYSFQASQQ